MEYLKTQMYVELIRTFFIEQCYNDPCQGLYFQLSKNRERLTSKIWNLPSMIFIADRHQTWNQFVILLCEFILQRDSLHESILVKYIRPIILHIIQPCFDCFYWSSLQTLQSSLETCSTCIFQLSLSPWFDRIVQLNIQCLKVCCPQLRTYPQLRTLFNPMYIPELLDLSYHHSRRRIPHNLKGFNSHGCWMILIGCRTDGD